MNFIKRFSGEYSRRCLARGRPKIKNRSKNCREKKASGSPRGTVGGGGGGGAAATRLPAPVALRATDSGTLSNAVVPIIKN